MNRKRDVSQWPLHEEKTINFREGHRRKTAARSPSDYFTNEHKCVH
jgi:hypothetical protein